jgi:hypothetical protein
MVDLNDLNEQLAFIVNGEKIWAMHNNLVPSKVRIVVIQDFFQILILQMKLKCSNKVFLTILSFIQIY